MNRPSSARTLLLRLLGLPLRIIAVILIALDELIWPLFRPLIRRFAALNPVRAMERAVARLNRWVILALLLLPFAVAEPLKLLSLVFLARGLWFVGIVMMLTGHLISFVLIDRIYHAGRDKLLTISWFAWIMGRLAALRDSMLGWLRGQPLWQSTLRMWRGLRASIRRTLRRR